MKSTAMQYLCYAMPDCSIKAPTTTFWIMQSKYRYVVFSCRRLHAQGCNPQMQATIPTQLLTFT
eukprot:1111870-Pyramimonas_sp.AAC.1